MKFKSNEKIKNFLSDFNKFVDYICTKDVTIGKATKYISKKFLFEMNEIMSIKQQDITVNSTQTSYPMLYLFYRLAVESKLFTELKIKGGKLALKPTERVEVFKQLNELEKYIFLLEVLWVDCDFEKLEFQSYNRLEAMKVAIGMERVVGKKANKRFLINEFVRDISTILLYLSYFGVMDVMEDDQMKLKYSISQIFYVKEVIITPVGEKIIKILDKKRNLTEWNISHRKEYGEWNVEFDEEFFIPFKGIFDDVELEKTLPRKKIKFKEGIYTFKVSLDKNTWSKIQLSAHDTLDELHILIQNAFEFDDDHMYSFFMDGEPWSKNSFKCPFDNEGPSTDEVEIGELDLIEKQSFLYIFDFGDEWRFNIEVIGVQNEDIKNFQGKIIEIKGESPQQYPYDEW
ncbi:MAG TPA: plasmid pRiA4b ORF-3 family protein [Clostridium sp.]|uniref:plasmid pRiA4b ORF-3 family protein n=1 Tax=Clostridium sp. TaxID=1506 RepID=UPI002F929B45